MKKVDAIVIGAGINGLVAGTLLARAGKRVHILERAAVPGGMAAAGADGFPRMAHLLYNLSPRVRRDLGLDTLNWPFKTLALPTVSLAEDGHHVVIRNGQAEFADGRAHPDAAAYRALHKRLVRYGALLRHLAEAPPPGFGDGMLSVAGLRQMVRLGRFGLGLRQMGKREMRRFLQVLLSNAHDLILDEIPDGPLAGQLAADAVRGAAAGPRGPGTVFSLLYRMGHGGGAALPMGGMDAVTAAFVTAAEDAGCTIFTGAEVTGLCLADDKVTGVETADGTRHEAGLVLSSLAAGPLARLTGPDPFDIETTRRIRHVRARGTAAKINLTLAQAPSIPGLPEALAGARLLIAPSSDYVERAFNPSKYRAMSETPVIEALCPGASDPTQGAAARMSLVVQYAPSDLTGGWDDAARDRLLKITLATLDRVAPGLSGTLEAAEVLSPDRIEAETGAPGGHWHHADLSLDQILALRPANGIGRYRMGPKGLYLCGAGTHPGGDIMGLAGRNAAQAALEDSK